MLASGSARISTAALLLAACGSTTSSPVPPGVTTYAVTMTGGFGAGTYAPGDTVYVFAAFPATTNALGGWTGDAVAASLTEWSGRFVMPARDVALAVTVAPVSAPLTVGTFTGATARAKTYRYSIPANPRGLILALHGTGGSNRIIERTEGYAITLEAVNAGYGVLSYDAEEVVAGDLNGDGNQRWDLAPTTANVDFANLDALIARLRTLGLISPTLPLYAFGMSNGSAMAVTLGALRTQSTLAAAFPNLRFRAVAGYCAPGPTTAAAVTITPTAWYMCRNDGNEQVGDAGNTAAERASAGLAVRGVPTDFGWNEPVPLYEERFVRTGLIEVADSRAIVQEFRRQGYLDARGFIDRPPSQIVTDLQTLGAGTFPAFFALDGAQRLAAIDALDETHADHQLFSDQAKRMLAFFNRF